jgi:predicted signal transduction protein with EAL and GGDEF domain
MMGLLWNKLKAIGQWVWHTIQMVFDALEWFTYWAVREIYAFSMAIVYIVNVFGVISINSALLAVVRTGNGKDFVKAFRAGWKFVFAIISLLLSLAIMAISIVGAVVPF